MRFEETERYAEIIRKYECKFGRTPKSLVYSEYEKYISITANVLYVVTLNEEAYILSSATSSSILGLNVRFGNDSISSTNRNLDCERFASYFSLLSYTASSAAVFVSYYKPVW